MKIAQVVSTFPTITETFIVNQIVGLLEHGHEVTIISKRKGDTFFIHGNIEVHDLLKYTRFEISTPEPYLQRCSTFFKWIIRYANTMNRPAFWWTMNIFKHGFSVFTLRRFFKYQSFITNTHDVFHVHFGYNAQKLVDLKQEGLLKNSKLVVSFHGNDLRPDKIVAYREHYKELFVYADNFIVNTAYTKDLLLKVNPLLKNVHTVPVGLATDDFKYQETTKFANFSMFFCGRLVAFKGVFNTLEILRELRGRGYENVHLHIVGDGEQLAELKARIESYDLESQITLHGWLKQDALKGLMRKSHVLLLPGIIEPQTGRAENQGLVVQEAQALGLPVIVSDVGGMKYGLLPDKTGYVIKANDIIGYADAIEQFIKEAPVREAFGKRGSAFVREHYDNAVIYKKLIAVYEGKKI